MGVNEKTVHDNYGEVLTPPSSVLVWFCSGGRDSVWLFLSEHSDRAGRRVGEKRTQRDYFPADARDAFLIDSWAVRQNLYARGVIH